MRKICARVLVSALVPMSLLSATPSVAGVAGEGSPPLESPLEFKILVEDDGVYRVDFDRLAGAGLAEPVPSDGLGLRVGGEAVPIWIEDGGDGSFDAGDHFEFIGRRLAGEHSWVHDYAWLNVYRLRTQGGGARMEKGQPAPSGDASPVRARLRRHLEKDKLLVRLYDIDNDEDDPWFWAKMVHNKPEPTKVPLDLAGVDENGTVDLAITVRGWSRPHNKASPEVSDHALAIKLANLGTGRERVLGVESWDGSDEKRIELRDLPASDFGPSAELRLMVPMRQEAKEGRALIDVLLLDSVELVYDHGGAIPEEGARLEWTAEESAPEASSPGHSAANAVKIDAAGEEPLVAYGEAGSRHEHAALSLEDLRRAGESAAWILAADRLRQPVAVVVDEPSNLRSADRRADYLMIVPHPFREAIEPLAALHRRRGLTVELIDIEDIYDEFNHGIAHPRAIRDFIAFAYESWRSPSPRFVLLVGDASWDVKNAEAVDAHYADWTYRRGESRDFSKNESTPYEGAKGRSRHFIPTWQTSTGQGHAASDHYFVDVAGDSAPELAIGRLPVASVAELEPIVRKIVRYVEEPSPDDWRDDVLFVTNEYVRYQKHSDRLAEQMETAGFEPRKIYPASSEESNEKNTEALVEALGSGQLLVHFLGHGGRYIWRTGPPDYSKNHDLFTLEDLDRLPPSGRLPVVVSLTCYSAPFDHPTADSIGEKFLRVEDRGAIGVIAASWRNSPSYVWGKIILGALTRPGATMGEALMEAKQEIRGNIFRETYLLLGDPAVPVALPESLSETPEEVAARAAGGAAETSGPARD